MKKKNIIIYPLMSLPLVLVNGLTLAADYFEAQNTSVNINVGILFLFVGVIMTITKLFFDFFVVMATAKVSKLEIQSEYVLDLLVTNMYIQWIGILLGFLISMFLLDGNYIAEQLIFAVTHGIYYVYIGLKLRNKTNAKVFYFSFFVIVLVYWIYIISNIVKFIKL